MARDNNDLTILLGIELENLDKLAGNQGKSIQDVLQAAVQQRAGSQFNPNSTTTSGLLSQMGPVPNQVQFLQQLNKTFEKAAKQQEAVADRIARQQVAVLEKQKRQEDMLSRRADAAWQRHLREQDKRRGKAIPLQPWDYESMSPAAYDASRRPPPIPRGGRAGYYDPWGGDSGAAGIRPDSNSEREAREARARASVMQELRGYDQSVANGMGVARGMWSQGFSDQSLLQGAGRVATNSGIPGGGILGAGLDWAGDAAGIRQRWADSRRMMFRDTGRSGYEALYGTTMADTSSMNSPWQYAMSEGETASLLRGLGKASGRFGSNKRDPYASSLGGAGGGGIGTSIQVTELMALQGKFGLGQEALGLISATEKAGAHSADPNLLPAAIGLAVSGGLTRGRFGEMFEILTRSIGKIATGVASVESVKTQEAFISTMGPQYIGNTAARGMAQDTLGQLASGSTSLSKYLAVSAGGFGRGSSYWESVGKMDVGMNAEGGLTPQGILSAVDNFPMVREAFRSGNEGSMRAMSNWLASQTGTKPAIVYDTLKAHYRGGMGTAQKNAAGAAGQGAKRIDAEQIPIGDNEVARNLFYKDRDAQTPITGVDFWNGTSPELESNPSPIDVPNSSPYRASPGKGTKTYNKNGAVSIGGAPGIRSQGLAYSGIFEPEMAKKIVEVSRDLGFNPDWLATAIKIERGVDKKTGKLAQNGWKRRMGLIGLQKGTSEWLGSSPDHQASLTDVEQMDYVAKYFTKHGWDAKGSNPIKSFEDMYAGIFYGNTGIKAGKDDALFTKKDNPEQYKANNGKLYGTKNNNMQTDANEDGVVTRGEMDVIAQSVFKSGKKNMTLRIEVLDNRINIIEAQPSPMTGAASTLYTIPLE